ncbi:MAG TPA: hypothetical protein VGI99_05895 [Gemmataceae bacterium]
MKRLWTVLALAAATSPLLAGEGALPLPTGMAPTAPQVPAPMIVNGLPASPSVDWSQSNFRDRLGIPTAAPVQAKPGVWSRMTNWRPFKSSGFAEPYDPLARKPQFCENCAPAVRQPLPPLPEGISTNRVVPASAVAPRSSGCADGSCGVAEKRSCCQKIKDWICYRQTPIHFPLIPTPRQPSIVSYFPYPDRVLGYGPGMNGTGSCTTGNCAANGKTGCGVRGGSCAACPAPGEAILPNYRLANP